MEYNLRPQWRQWNYPACQQPMCGRCGLQHNWSKCFAINKVCFKCQKFGHYGRMCRNVSEVTQISSINRGKSKKKHTRDAKRLAEYLNRKNLLRELPFSSIRPGTFRETVVNTVLQQELSEVKEKLTTTLKERENLKVFVKQCSEENDILQGKLEAAILKENELSQKLKESSQCNLDLSKKLLSSVNREQKLRLQERNTEAVSKNQQYIAQIQDLNDQLQTKQDFIEFLTKRYNEMKSEYQEEIEAEKNNAVKEKQLREAIEAKCAVHVQRQQHWCLASNPPGHRDDRQWYG